jgi:hypothetical protein
VPDRRTHRGPHGEDHELFAASRVPTLATAVAELSWLLSRGYAPDSSLKLVGDRHALRDRARTAVGRCACSDQDLADRRARMVESVAGRDLWIDGFNVLTTVEAAFAHGVVIVGRDGCFRDMASMHGSWRRVEETDAAIAALVTTVDRLAPRAVRVLLDAPVSNSGRLAERWRTAAPQAWSVELVRDPDPVLRTAPWDEAVVASADAGVLGACGPWIGLAAAVVHTAIERPWIVDLSRGSDP